MTRTRHRKDLRHAEEGSIGDRLEARVRRTVRPAAILALSLTASACVVGPNYTRPAAPIAAQFKEARGWMPSHPADSIDRGAWWSVYNDPVLNGLEERVAEHNQTVAEFVANYRQARQITVEARSLYFPTVSASGSLQDSRSGRSGVSTTTGGGAQTTGLGNTGTGGTGLGSGTGATGLGGTGTGTGGTSSTGGTGGGTIVAASGGNSAITTYTATLDASWTPDFWGKIRREVEGDRAQAQASAADIANARLSAQGLLASDYFSLRANDVQQKLLRDTIQEYQRFETLTLNQYHAGTVSRANVISAQTQLLGTQASLTDEGLTRAAMEHAIAVLVGVAPSELTIAPTETLATTVPVVPVDVPSTLLQRRPDIAAAERLVAQANAQIGVQEAAFYPDISLTGSEGLAATSFGALFNASSNFWSVGGTIAEELIDFGERRAAVRAAAAQRDFEIATYRQTVLTAFQSVEDQLSALHVYEGEIGQRQQTLDAARQAYQIDLNEYKAGTVDFLTVLSAEATVLSDAEQVITVQQEALQASAVLIQDLGGGWRATDLPKG